MELGMSQVNVLPLDIQQPADVYLDKISYSSSSSRQSGYKQEARDHFSGLVDKHLQDKKNENHQKNTHANDKVNDYEHNDNNGKILSDQTSPATNIRKDTIVPDKKIVLDDTDAKRSTAENINTEDNTKTKDSSEGRDEKVKDGSTEALQTKTDEQVLEQSQSFLSLLDSSAKILQPTSGVDNGKVEVSSNTAVGRIKSTEETLAAILVKSIKVASDDSAAESEIGNEPDSEEIANETPADKNINKSAKNIRPDVEKQIGSEKSHAAKTLVASDNKSPVKIGEKTVHQLDDTEMSQAKTKDKENTIKTENSSKNEVEVNGEKDIKNNNGSAEVKSIVSTSTNKDVDFSRSAVIDAVKKEAESSNISKTQTTLTSADKEVVNSSYNRVLEKSVSVSEQTAKENDVTLVKVSADNENAAKQQGSQTGTQQKNMINNPQSHTQQNDKEDSVNVASEAEDKISHVELDHVSAQKATENEIVNNTTPNLGSKEGSKAENSFTEVASQTNQVTTKAYDHAQALVAEAEALNIEKVEQNKNNVQALNETISIFRKDFADAVKDKIMVIISKKLQQFDIKLDPPELGSVHVKVNLQNEQAVVNFTVQNQSAKEAFEQSLDRLKDMLAEHGVDVGDANVEQQSAQNSENNFEQGENTRKGDLKGDSLAENVEGQTVLSGDFIDSSDVRVDYYA